MGETFAHAIYRGSEDILQKAMLIPWGFLSNQVIFTAGSRPHSVFEHWQ